MKFTSAKTAIIVALATFTTTLTTPANAGGYLANYEAYVISVEPWDNLNMRKWPAYYSQKVGHIPHNGQYVWVQRCVVKPNGSSSDWCKVNYGGDWGWVKKSFLAEHH